MSVVGYLWRGILSQGYNHAAVDGVVIIVKLLLQLRTSRRTGEEKGSRQV